MSQREIPRGAPQATEVPVYLVPIAVGRLPGSIDLSVGVSTLLSSWRLLVMAILIGAAAGYGVSFAFHVWYRSSVTVMPAPEDRGASALSQAASQFGGLASLAGIRLPASGATRTEALATLRAKEFVGDFIKGGNLLPALYASHWDQTNARWNLPVEDIPTLDDAIEYFQRRVLNVKEDAKTGLIEIVVDWKDRQLAAAWANEVVIETNARVRKRAIDDARKSFDFLSDELHRTDVVELRQSIARLMESQLNSIALANTREQYAFVVIDPARPAETKEYVRPNRVAFSAAGSTLALFLASCWQLVRRRRE